MPYFVERWSVKIRKWFVVSHHKSEYRAEKWKNDHYNRCVKLRIIFRAKICTLCAYEGTTARPLDFINLCPRCQRDLREDYNHAYANCNCIRCRNKKALFMIV